MIALDANFKLIENFKANLEKVNIGLNREEMKIIIDCIEIDTHFHFHKEIGLSDEDMLRLSNEEVGQFMRNRALLNMKAALSEKPEEVKKLMATYTVSALTTGTSSLSASVYVANKDESPMASGDFIQQLPSSIEASSPVDFISVEEDIRAEIIDEKQQEK